MVEIEQAKCVGCGLCVSDCVMNKLALKDGKARCGGACIRCGHCVAICPENAVAIPEYDMADIEEHVKGRGALEPESFLHAVKFRRSIRQYADIPVEREKLELIVQAGRYTATGSNRQGCRFIVVRESLPAFRALVWNAISQAQSGPEPPPEELMNRLRSFEKLREQGIDYLFRDAPAVIYIAAESAVDAALAAQNMEHMAVAQGLGVMYDGFLVYAANLLEAPRKWLETDDKPLRVCMLAGVPRVEYKRTVPRKKADVRWR